MISGLQSIETGVGLGLMLTDELLKRINSNRSGQTYTCVKDVGIVNNTDLKN